MNKYILSLIIIVIYVVLANFVSANISFSEEEGIILGGKSDLNLGFSDSVSIEITRPRWYGTITELETESDIQMLNIFPLPLRDGNFNWIYVHLLLLLGVGGIIKFKEKKKWDSNLDGDFSSSSYYPI